MKIINTQSKGNIFHLLTLFVLMLTTTSCAHLLMLDNAQNAFNKGAEIENAAMFNQSSISSVSPSSFYNLAYAHVNKALKYDSKLSKAGVLGSAQSLKALCEWKLKEYAKARSSAKTAIRNLVRSNSPNNVNLPRDLAVMQALDGLIGIEEANDGLYQFFATSSISPDAAKQEYEKLIRKGTGGTLQDAIAVLEKIATQVSSKHDVQTYFLMSKLAGIKVWSDALSKVKNNFQSQDAYKGANKTWYEDEEDAFIATRDKALAALAQKLTAGKDDSVYLYWKFIL